MVEHASLSAAVVAPRPAFLAQLRRRFFRTPFETAISLAGAAFLAWLTWSLFGWGVLRAVWTSPDGTAAVCRGSEGACWAVIHVRWRLIMFGLFPFDEQWRSTVACLVIVLTGVASCVPFFWRPLRLAPLWLAGFGIFYLLMHGGVFGWRVVSPADWGGLTLTVFVYAGVVLLGMPLAICLALLRQSRLPLVSGTTAVIIDTVRSLPLISVLFTAALILPFVLPSYLVGDKIWRIILGYALFFAVYQAEILRSGITFLHAGQQEAAKALGLNYWQRTTRIILPQAFRRALPPTINQLVISFKDTSLIVIIGFFDILASGNAAFGAGEWSFAWVEVYCFVALIYFVFVFSLSRYGVYLERRVRVGKY